MPKIRRYGEKTRTYREGEDAPEVKGPFFIQGETSRILAAEDYAAEIRNFEVTAERTLRAIIGPVPLCPDYSSDFNYGLMHGIFHAVLRGGQQSVLLLHTGNEIRVFEGWNRNWRVLLGPSSSSPDIEVDLVNDGIPRFPTQFEATPNGVIICPQGEERAYFYDGEIILPLGYNRAPSPPTPRGPGTGNSGSTTSTADYDHDSGGDIDGPYGYGRVGTMQSQVTSTTSGAQLLSGFVRAGMQWVDYFGNLSPVSEQSSPVVLQQHRVGATLQVEDGLKSIAWTGIEPGREGTIGRIIGRTKDIGNTGDNTLYEILPNAMGGAFGFATIPDNISTIYPDNIPDGWLFKPMVDVIPLEPFKLCRVAFSRLWAANFLSEPGVIRASLPNQWGTFTDEWKFSPDPAGGYITGIWAVTGGLMVFTNNTTFLIVETDDGTGFRAGTLASTIGCVAPSSIATLPNGLTIWLGRGGYYSWNPASESPPGLATQEIAETIRRITKTRALQACAAVDPIKKEYRCWVPFNGSVHNTLCQVFDGSRWMRRDDVTAVAVCVTRDHRGLMIVAGAQGSGNKHPFVLDHEAKFYTPAAREYVLESTWINVNSSMFPESPQHLFFWLRESIRGTATVTIYRDHRKDAVHTETINLYDETNEPPWWNRTNLVATGERWVRPKPHWVRVSIDVSASESFKFKLSTSNPIEIIGFAFDTIPMGWTGRISP